MKKLNIPFLTLLVVSVVSLILIISLVASISSDLTDPAMGNWITINLRWAYVLLFLAVVVLILFALFQFFSNLKSAKGGLFGIAAVLLIVLISWLLGSSEYPQFFGVEKFIADGTITPTITRVIDTALYSTYIIFGLAILALIYSSVSRYFK